MRCFILCCVFTFTYGCHAFAAQAFKHPGSLNNAHDLAAVAARLQAPQSPLASQWQALLALAHQPLPGHCPPAADENGQKRAAQQTYANALAWAYTGKAEYAERAKALLTLWAEGFKGYQRPPAGQGHQHQLQAAWIGSLLAPAAEILRRYHHWPAAEQAKVSQLFTKAFYPLLETPSPWNGNVDLTQIEALMAMAIFNDDTPRFQQALTRLNARLPAYIYTEEDPSAARTYGGQNESSWFMPAQWVNGLTQETCRDKGHHAQYGLAAALHASEMAWNQGVDVYAKHRLRLTSAMELLAGEILKQNTRFQTLCPTPQADWQKHPNLTVFNTFQMGYHHYHHRLGLALPQTRQLLFSPEWQNSHSDWNIFFEGLTHGIAAP